MNPISGLLIGTLLSVSMVPSQPDRGQSAREKSAAPSALAAVNESRASLAQPLQPERTSDKRESPDKQAIDLAEFALDSEPSTKTVQTAELKDVAESRPTPPKVPKRQALVFKATWCGACQLLNPEWPKLRKVSWRVGNRKTDHFRMVDSDQHPDLISRHGVTALPTIILLEDGREIARTGRILNAVDLAEFYYGRLE